MTIRDIRDYIRVLLYAYYTTITGWGGVLLTLNSQTLERTDMRLRGVLSLPGGLSLGVAVLHVSGLLKFDAGMIRAASTLQRMQAGIKTVNRSLKVQGPK